MKSLSLTGWPAEAALVRATGTVLDARVEVADDPRRIDHVWITLDAGLEMPIAIAINTFSRQSLDAGFDPRMRVGILREKWLALPSPGVRELAGFSYADYETREDVTYAYYERTDLEALLLTAARGCLVAEVIGTPYHRRRIGIHQIHSRRASCAKPEEWPGRDGALRFYFADGNEAQWLFFKFCGQV
jgi:hypothetical protein